MSPSSLKMMFYVDTLAWMIFLECKYIKHYKTGKKVFTNSYYSNITLCFIYNLLLISVLRLVKPFLYKMPVGKRSACCKLLWNTWNYL